MHLWLQAYKQATMQQLDLQTCKQLGHRSAASWKTSGPIHQQWQRLQALREGSSPGMPAEGSLQSNTAMTITVSASSTNQLLVTSTHMLSSSLPAPHLPAVWLHYLCSINVGTRLSPTKMSCLSTPEQVKHFCLDHRASFNLLENVLQRLCKSVAILLLVCMVEQEVAKQQPILPPATLTSWVIQADVHVTLAMAHMQKRAVAAMLSARITTVSWDSISATTKQVCLLSNCTNCSTDKNSATSFQWATYGVQYAVLW